jgi:transposase
MAKKYTDEFRRDAVRMATTSGLTRPQLSSDFGIGVSTLNKWVQQHQHDDLMSGPLEDVEKENTRLNKEVRLLREEREVLKKAAVGSTGQRNGSFKGISWRLKTKCFSGPSVEAQCDLIKVVLRVNG